MMMMMLMMMMMMLILGTAAAGANDNTINVNVDMVSSTKVDLPHYWENTGWCPPEPLFPKDLEDYALQESSWQMHAHIAAIPYQGIKIVRVHDLLFLIEVPSAMTPENIDPSQFNFTRLDRVVHLVSQFGLALGFEIMGNPQIVDATGKPTGIGIFTDWGDAKQLVAWQEMVSMIATRYMSMYGVDVVRKWRFETWNEPDHACNPKNKMKAGIDCNVTKWIGYFDACGNGLRAVDEQLVFGGPGTGGATMSTPFLVDMIKHVAMNGNKSKLDYIQWHDKGYTSNTDLDVTIADTIIATAPKLAASIPIGNEEVDPLGGWQKVEEWRGDVRYPASAAKILLMHQKKLREDMSGKVIYGYHQNDNAFLNYGDQWFDQRTLTVRFLMNKTNTVEVIRKPIINLMAMLSLLGDIKHSVQGDPDVVSSPFGIWCTSRLSTHSNEASEIGVLMYNSGPDLTVANGSTVSVAMGLTSVSRSTYGSNPILTHYRIDSMHGNPRVKWEAMGGSANPYPTPAQFEELRDESELTVLSRGPVTVSSDGAINISTTLPEPSVSMFQLCFQPQNLSPPPPVEGLSLRVTPTTTPPTVMAVWKGSSTRCLQTYEVMVSNTTASGSFERVNQKDLIFSAHVFTQPSLPVAKGCVKIVAVDVWGVRSLALDTVCI